MGMFKQKINTLHDLFVQELKDVYSAEGMIIQAMPKMIEKASSPQLKQHFQEHLEQTREQYARLEEVFDMLDMAPEEEKCDGMEGILKDGQKLIAAEGNPQVIDAGLISAAQKVEHYEISSYGTLRTMAETMGHHDIAQKLETTLKQEKQTDKLLTQVAESSVNQQAPQM